MKKKTISRMIKTTIMAAALIITIGVGGVPGSSVDAFAAGFSISNGKLIDANGNEFVMRGINEAHNWYQSMDEVSLKAIANTGANTVRIVLGDGQQFSKDNIDKVKNLISLCEQNKLVAILEVHDITGKNSIDQLVNTAKYWIEIKDALKGHEDTVILNVANEWYGSWETDTWAQGYEKVIPMLRDAGIDNTIMVDCAGYGQYPKSVHEKGMDVFKSDEDANTMFSIHFYEYAGGNADQVKSALDGVRNQGLPVCVGEFGYKHVNGDVDEDTIVNYCQEQGIGWLAWSWYGNSGGVEYLDLVTSPDGSAYTEWGDILFNKLKGMSTSKVCSVYGNSEVTNPDKPVTPDQPETPEVPEQPETPDQPEQPESGSLTFASDINNWGSGYQVNVKIKNTSSSTVNGWTLKLKKSEVNPTSYWNVNVKEDGEYVVITPVSWNSTIAAGQEVSFGIQGSGSCNSGFWYELS